MPYYTERNGMRRQTAGTYEVSSTVIHCCSVVAKSITTILHGCARSSVLMGKDVAAWIGKG